MRKVLLTIMLIAVSSLSIGCGKKYTDDTPNATETQPQTEEVTELITYEPLATVRDRDIEESEKFDYEIYDGKVIITKYKGTETDVVIPDEVEGVPVGEIGFYCFEANWNLVSVTLPETVTVIGENAFMSCNALAQINIPSGLTNIERGAFAGCASLTEMTIPSAVTSVHEEAFTMCDGLVSLTIENPDLAYENWGLEELPNVVIHAPEGSAVSQWASAMGKLG